MKENGESMDLKKSLKPITLFILVISALLFLKFYSNEHVPPLYSDVNIDGELISQSVSSNDATFLLASNKLYITDLNNNMKHIVSMNGGNTLIHYLDAYKGRFFILVYNYRDNSSCIASEKILELDKDGKVIATIFEMEHPENVNNLRPIIDSFNASEHGIYYKQIEGNKVHIIQIPYEDDKGRLVLYSFDPIVVDAPVINTFFDRDDSKLYVQTFWDDVYSYSFKNNTVTSLADMEKVTYGDLHKSQNSVTLHVTGMFAVINYAFWISCLILAIFAVSFIIRFLIMLPFNKSRVAIIMAVFLGVSIYVFSQMLMEVHRQSREKLLEGISNTVMAEISNRDIVKMTAKEDFLQNKENPLIREDALYLRELAEAISLANNHVTSLYIMGYFPDNQEDIHVAFSSFNHYPFGATISNLQEMIGKVGYVPGTKTGVYVDKNAAETDRIAISFLYDEMDRLLFCVEVGATDDIQLSEIARSVGMKTLHLLAILAFMWSLFDCYHIFIEDFKRFIAHKKAGNYDHGASYNLASLFVFIVNIILNLDFVLLVFVVNRICDGLSPSELAIMFSIPFTAYGIGGFSGSVVVGPILRLLGRRKAAIISASCTIILFSGMASACIFSNLYILAVCKFFEGIFVRSLLSTIGEGIPYDIEDEEERKRGIVSVNSVVSGSIIIGTMISGFFLQYVGFAVVYMTGAALGIVLLILSYIIFRKNEEKGDVEGVKAFLNSWAVYLEPRSMAYLIMIILVYSFMTGYTEFIFPLLVGSANLGEMALADMSILATTATLIGVEKLLPKDRYSPMQLINISFTTVGICLLVVFVQPSLEVAFIVLLLVGLFSRPLFNYRVLELTKIASAYGVDEKDIQGNYYAVENGICMFQAPVLGPLCNISVALACGVVGGGCLLFPNIYSRVLKRGRS